MRLDKFLCELNIGSRSQVKELIRHGKVSVNNTVVKTADLKIDESKDIVCVQGQTLSYRKFYYYMLNKPAGVVSATQDNLSDTVIGLLRPEDRHTDLFPVGRLDKDTEGLLLLTNDGALAHRLLSPGRHVDKTYHVTIEHALTAQEIQQLEQGVDIGEDKLTLPARVEVLSPETELLLTIHEGKFHQVKRMLFAVNNLVTALRRTAFGGLKLDGALAPGEYRPLSEEEVEVLHEA